MATVLLGSILLEPNRWTSDKQPTLRLSEWSDCIAAAGFDGIELWENHAVTLGPAEVMRLAVGQLRCPVFNCYLDFAHYEADRWEAVAAAIGRLRSSGVKWNFGANPSNVAVEMQGVRRFADMVGPDVRMLCECHPGTVAETPETAAGLLDELGPPDRFAAITHSARTQSEVQAWFRHLGPRIQHVHVVLQNEVRSAVDARPDALDSLREVWRLGRQCSYTLEFTRGIGTATDVPDVMLSRASDDLAVIRRVLD